MSAQKTIAIVIPWYAPRSGGGAEVLCATIAKQLVRRGFAVEVLTTGIQNFRSNWDDNYWQPGEYIEDDIRVLRFRADSRNADRFNAINDRLMHAQPITRAEEKEFMTHMVHSTELIEHIKHAYDRYTALFALPYMFGTTFDVASQFPEKTILIPCFHDEPYAHLAIYKDAFRAVRGLCYNTPAEQAIAERLLGIPAHKGLVTGIGVEVQPGMPGVFARQYNITSPYVLYLGRKDEGKNIHTLIHYFTQYTEAHPTAPVLVLAGSGRIELDEATQRYIIDLGMISETEKQDALAGAFVLCQPSLFESFSIVLMEAWLNRCPVLVHSACTVTQQHAALSNGGLWFSTYLEFAQSLQYFDQHPDARIAMGVNGEHYVRKNYSHERVMARYLQQLS